MKRLSGTDALFLSMETPSWHQHVGGLTILDPGDGRLDFETIVDLVEQRLDWAPKFRWKLKNAPFGLDRPVWIDDADFDVRRHVRRIGVPGPGGPAETGEVAGALLSTQLDRRFPLWEMWYLEGLAEGRAALLMKYHHCLLDGVAGASLATALLDIEPDATKPWAPPPPAEQITAGPEPTDAEQIARLLGEGAWSPIRLGKYLVDGAARIAAGAKIAMRDRSTLPMLGAPKTPFNAPIGPRRNLAFASASMDDLKKIKTAHDVKVNDVILAVVAFALREYLLDLDTLPGEPLVSGVPVSTRAEGDASLDNQVRTMFVRLATDITDPIERLEAIHASSMSAKEMTNAMSARQIQSLGEVASPFLLSMAIRGAYETQLLTRAPARINTLVSNVPGPPIDLYAAGARVTGMFPCSVIMEGMGVNATVISYKDRVDFGFHVDPELVPDPWAIANRVTEAVDELLEASGLGPSTPVENPFGE